MQSRGASVGVGVFINKIWSLRAKDRTFECKSQLAGFDCYVRDDLCLGASLGRASFVALSVEVKFGITSWL